MEVSILIVSKNRKEDLALTLSIIERYIDKSKDEILVCLDGCSDSSKDLEKFFSWVNWYKNEKSLGSSTSRNMLFKKAKGTIFIGFDDDAHPLNENFVQIVTEIFKNNDKLGIIAFKEIKGIYNSDDVARTKIGNLQAYICSEFIGCGFAITREAYLSTNGFPKWIDIYGEEACVSLEVLNNNFDILATNQIAVNHRVDLDKRNKQGYNYFRFKKQLKNSTFYYLIYYKWPFISILKLYGHNFFKYALTDFNYLFYFFRTIIICFLKYSLILKYRNPISIDIIKKKNKLDLPF